MLTIEQFCDRHKVGDDDREWMLDNYADIASAWTDMPFWRLWWVAAQPGVLTDSELRSFANFCKEQRARFGGIAQSENAQKVLSKRPAVEQAQAASEAAAGAAASKAAWEGRSIIDGPDIAACREAAGLAFSEQADWLRENTRPNFEAVQ